MFLRDVPTPVMTPQCLVSTIFVAQELIQDPVTFRGPDPRTKTKQSLQQAPKVFNLQSVPGRLNCLFANLIIFSYKYFSNIA